MSRMITRSLSGINMKKPIQVNQPKPVAKNLKTSTKLKRKSSANQKIAATSQVKQANDASMSSLKPRISIRPFDLELTKSFPVADLNIMKPSQADTRTDCQGTSRPVLKVLPMRRQTTESGFRKEPISSRRKTVSTTTPRSITPVRRSERIRLNESTPIYFPSRKSPYQKPVIRSFLVDIPKVNKNFPLTSSTKISKGSHTKSASSERKEPTKAQPKTAAKRKLAVHLIPVEYPKVDESLPSTSTTKISTRRYTKSASNERKEPTAEAQPKTAAKRKLAVHPNPVENPKVNESLPSTSTTKISNRRKTTFVSKEHKEPTDSQPKIAAKRKLRTPTADHPSPVEIPEVNENLPSTSATKISNEHKEPTDGKPKTAAVLRSLVETPKVNESLPSTSATMISKRRQTMFVLKEYKEPTEAQAKTAAKRMEAPTAVLLPPAEIPEVNENMPSTSATNISNEHKEPTVGKPKTAALLPSLVETLETPKVNQSLPSTSTTKISKRRQTMFVLKEYKEPTKAQPKTAAKRKLQAPTAVHPSPVETPKVNENMPSTSATKISNRRKTRCQSTMPALLTTVDLTPIPKKATGQMSAVDTSALKIRKEYENLPSTSMTMISKPRITFISKDLIEPTYRNPNEIRKLNENLPSTSEATISTRLSPKVARKSAVSSVLAEIPNCNSPSTSNVMPNEDKIEISIPNELKTLLVDDIKIVREGKQYKIPSTQNVAQIIDLYVELKTSVRKYENRFGFTFKQIFYNLLEYFDALLGEQLLYESERIRYLDMLNNFPGERMSTLYPPIYLLRLFVKLNSLLQFSCRDKETLRYIVNYVNEFAKYLAENKSIFSDMNIFC